MLIFIIAYLGGVFNHTKSLYFTSASICFRKDTEFLFKNGLPLLLGMVFTFSIFSILAIVGGEWLTHANDTGRVIALVFAVMGMSLLFPEISEKIFAPISGLGGKIGQNQLKNQSQEGFVSSLIVGVGTGLLWAPCAGPILGLVLTGASVQGNAFKSILLLMAYSMGAATSLGLAILLEKKFLRK